MTLKNIYKNEDIFEQMFEIWAKVSFNILDGGDFLNLIEALDVPANKNKNFNIEIYLPISGIV